MIRRHILLVDDEADFAETMAMRLQLRGYKVTLAHNGKEALDRFIEATQKNVSGTVRLKLHKGNCSVVGRKSPHSLYKRELATYEEGDVFDQSLAKGFIEIWGLPYKGSCRNVK